MSRMINDDRPVLEVRNLQTSFFGRAGQVRAVDDVSFTVGRGKIIGLVGESGSGKSITAYSIMGLIDAPGKIHGGEILFDGVDLTKLAESELRKLRGNRIAMILQDPMMTLNPVLRIGTQMIETVLAHKRVSSAQARDRAIEALRMVGIPSPEQRLSAYPHQFSGGMRQRVAIAIAMLHSPDLLIADEPTTALDVTIQSQIISEVQRLARDCGTAVIWVTHDLSVVAGLADELAVMYAGRIVESGTVDEILDNPQHPYTQGLIASIPSRSTKERKRLTQIPGMAPNMLELGGECAFRERCGFRQTICNTAPPITQPTVGRTLRCYLPSMREELTCSKPSLN